MTAAMIRQTVRRAGKDWDKKAFRYGAPLGMLMGVGVGHKLTNDDFRRFAPNSFGERLFQRTVFGMGGAIVGAVGGGFAFYFAPFWVPLAATSILYEMTSGVASQSGLNIES